MIETVNVLDHGYVKFIESMGSDQRVVENARQSTSGAFQGWGPKHAKECPISNPKAGEFAGCHCTANYPGDEKLLNYLYKNGHISPFECCTFTVEMQAPILIFRQLFRHRTLSPNEYSGRYTQMLEMNYLPTIERLMMGGDGKNKQAGTIKDAEVLTLENAVEFQNKLNKIYCDIEEVYEWALKVGVPKELARIHKPVAGYSRARITGNLRNWLSVVSARSDYHPEGLHAQWEIRQFINPVAEIIKELYPRTWQVYVSNQ